MKLPFLLLTILSFPLFCFSQFKFGGWVKAENDTGQIMYQANLRVTPDKGKPFSLKSSYDGSFQINTEPNRSYSVLFTTPGYKDTSLFFKTDDMGIPDYNIAYIFLRKDGLRLKGFLLNGVDSFPIVGAVIELKSVETRSIKKVMTDATGYFNLYMDYGTNYRFSVNKYCDAIFNKYNDTSFYIATIGINLPLDYEIDVFLNASSKNQKRRKYYDPMAVPDNKKIKAKIIIDPDGIDHPDKAKRKKAK